ncbi:MAG TPA: DUF58 domain-containing protein [Gryllotalpicola sp.]
MPRPLPTVRGWVVGACGVAALVAAAWFARVDLLFIGLLLTLAPLAALIAVALDRPWLTVTRSYSPDTIVAGDEAQVRLEVRNRSPRPTPGLAWSDGLPAGLAAVPVRSFPSLAGRGATGERGGDAVTLRYTARTLRRGALPLGPLRVVRTDPFGLARSGYAVGESKTLLVTPRVFPLGRGGPDDARGDGADQELVRHATPSADEVIPREYRPGDPLRRVLWRATARQDRLMVRQEEQRSNPQAWLLLDTVSGRGPAAHGSNGPAFERAVELAASITMHLLGLGYLVGVVETGERQLGGSYGLPGGDHELVAQLAALEQTRGRDGDHAARLAAALRTSSTASPVFLLLADGDQGVWVELGPLRRYAEPAVAFLAAAAQGARPLLEASGWICVDIDAETEAPGAWSAAVTARQRLLADHDAGARRA